MKFSQRQRYIAGLIALSLLASAILTFIFRDQIQVSLVVPVSHIAWYINMILTTVPQPVFWAVLVLGGVYIAGRALLRSLPAPRELPEPSSTGRSLSRYQYWLWYLSSFQFSQFSTEHMGRNLARFVVEILAFQEHLTANQVEERLLSGELVLPEEISNLIKTRRLPINLPAPTPFRRFLDRFIRRRAQPSPNQIDISAANEKIIRILQFIEERLEIQHESTQ